jgi:hypothetical protein
MDLVFPAGRAALAEAAAAILRADPVPGPLPRAAAETIRWSGGLQHHGRRTRELAQRLPVVNGAHMITNLLDYRLRSALARGSAATPAPGGHR